MSIKEALEGGPVERKRTILKRDRSDLCRGELVADIFILEQSGVIGMLDELKEIIQPDFPDVEITRGRYVTGHVFKRIQWNGRNTLSHLRGRVYALFDAIEIVIDLNGDLHVGSKEGEELITKAQWGSDRRNLEYSLADAYRDPMRFIVADPPFRLSEETRQRMLGFRDVS